MKNITLFLLLLSVTGKAFGCHIPEQVVRELSFKYKHNVSVDIERDNGVIDVYIAVPNKIGELYFTGMDIKSENEYGGLNFIVMSVGGKLIKDKRSVWYVVSEKYFSETSVTVNYGDGCDIYLKYVVSEKGPSLLVSD